MKYFFDTEFIEYPDHIHPISIALVSEDDREYYAVVKDFPIHMANDFVKAHVIPQLPPEGEWKTVEVIKLEIREFIGLDFKPEFWAYYSAYDWVLFCQIQGRMLDLPKSWPKFCMDIKQLCVTMGNPQLSKQPNEHDALEDARWNKRTWEFLQLSSIYPADFTAKERIFLETMDKTAEKLQPALPMELRGRKG